MNSKVSLSRAVFRGTAVALALAAGVATTTFAVAQGGGTPSPAVAGDTDQLAALLSVARGKAEIVALLNAAAQAGMTKLDIIQALTTAQQLTRNFAILSILSNIQTLVVASAAQDGGTGAVSFVDNGSATGSTFVVAGINAASGSVIDTSDIGGGFNAQNFQPLYVGPYAS